MRIQLKVEQPKAYKAHSCWTHRRIVAGAANRRAKTSSPRPPSPSRWWPRPGSPARCQVAAGEPQSAAITAWHLRRRDAEPGITLEKGTLRKGETWGKSSCEWGARTETYLPRRPGGGGARGPGERAREGGGEGHDEGKEGMWSRSSEGECALGLSLVRSGSPAARGDLPPRQGREGGEVTGGDGGGQVGWAVYLYYIIIPFPSR
jgi:hypothetical protein